MTTGGSILRSREISSRKLLSASEFLSPVFADYRSILIRSVFHDRMKPRSSSSGKSLLFIGDQQSFFRRNFLHNARSSGSMRPEPSTTTTTASAFSKCCRESSTPMLSTWSSVSRDTGSIPKHTRQTVKADRLLDHITGRAGHRSYDHSFRTEQRVQQARLADIGPAANTHRAPSRNSLPQS